MACGTHRQGPEVRVVRRAQRGMHAPQRRAVKGEPRMEQRRLACRAALQARSRHACWEWVACYSTIALTAVIKHQSCTRNHALRACCRCSGVRSMNPASGICRRCQGAAAAIRGSVWLSSGILMQALRAGLVLLTQAQPPHGQPLAEQQPGSSPGLGPTCGRPVQGLSAP